MTSTSHMNIVLGQGNAIKEVHNVKNSHLEMNQQFVAQSAEDKRKDDRVKVKEFDKGSRVDLKPEDEGEKRNREKHEEKDSDRKRGHDTPDLRDENLIDIKV